MNGRSFGAPALGLAAGTGALLGVLLALALGGGGARKVATFTRTVSPRSTPTGVRLISTASVPGVVGTRLDHARGRLLAAGFTVAFAGVRPGATAESQWHVTAQDPKGGRSRPVDTAVRLRITRG